MNRRRARARPRRSTGSDWPSPAGSKMNPKNGAGAPVGRVAVAGAGSPGTTAGPGCARTGTSPVWNSTGIVGPAEPVPPPAVAEDVVDQRLPDDLRQELVHDDPLPVVDDRAPGVEPDVARQVVGPPEVHGPVVGQQERDLQAGDDEVLVVARVGDDRASGRCCAAGPRTGRRSRPGTWRGRDGAVELRAHRRAAAVHRVEVEPRVARVRCLRRARSRRRAREVVSKVTSWSRNCPTNVVPAVMLVTTLSRLFGLSSGLVISRIGPSCSGSLASSTPPGLPDLDHRVADGGRPSGPRTPEAVNIRLNRGSGAAVTTGPSTAAASASTLPRVSAPAVPATPAPIPPRNRRRPILVGCPSVSSVPLRHE